MTANTHPLGLNRLTLEKKDNSIHDFILAPRNPDIPDHPVSTSLRARPERCKNGPSPAAHRDCISRVASERRKANPHIPARIAFHDRIAAKPPQIKREISMKLDLDCMVFFPDRLLNSSPDP